MRIVFSILFFLVGILIPAKVAVSVHGPRASTHVLSGGVYTCDGANQTVPIEVYIPPPPYFASGEVRGYYTNCAEVRIRSCRYEAGLSIIITPPKINSTSRLTAGLPLHVQRQTLVLRIIIENSTLLSPANGSSAALLLGSLWSTTNSSNSGSTGEASVAIESSPFQLDLVMLNSTVSANTAIGAAFAMRFANISLKGSRIAVANCKIEALAFDVTGSAAYVWAYDNVIVRDASTVVTVDSVLKSRSSSGSAYVWYYLSGNNMFNSLFQTVRCNITSSSSGGIGGTYIWYYYGNNSILNSTMMTAGCTVTSSGRNRYSFVWYYESSNIITNSIMQTLNCNIASRSLSISGGSYVWCYYGNNSIANSTVITTGCTFTSISSGSTGAFVWHYKGYNKIVNATLQTIGCNIISSSNSGGAVVWYYENDNHMVNSTAQTVGCNITSGSSSGGFSSCVNNKFVSLTLQTIGCNITSSSSSGSRSGAVIWYCHGYNQIVNSTLLTLNSNIVSSSSSIHMVCAWHFDGDNTVANSALQTVGCNITSTSYSSGNVVTWYYTINNNILNSTLQIAWCNIRSSSGGGNVFIWQYINSNTIVSSTLQTVGCYITSSSSSSSSAWYYSAIAPSSSTLLDNTVITLINSSVRLNTVGCSVSSLLHTSALRAIGNSALYWSHSRLTLCGSATSQNLATPFACSGTSNCGGLLVSVDSSTLPLRAVPTSLFPVVSITVGQGENAFDLFFCVPPYASNSASCTTSNTFNFSLLRRLIEYSNNISSASIEVIHGDTTTRCGVYVPTPTLTSAPSYSHSFSASSSASFTTTTSSSASRSATCTVFLSLSRSTSISLTDLSSAKSSPSFSFPFLETPTVSFSMTLVTSFSTRGNVSNTKKLLRSASASVFASRTNARYRTRSPSATPLQPSRTRTVHVIAPIPAASRFKEISSSVLVAIVSTVSVAGVSGGQLSSMNAMARLAGCEDKDDEVPVLVHPLRFSLFSAKSKAAAEVPSVGQYAAAAISNSVLIPLIVWVVVYWVVPYTALLVANGTHLEHVRSRFGWPCVMLLPFVTLAEGIAVSVVMSWRSGVNYLVMCGVVGFVSVALVLVWWVRALIVFIPRRGLHLSDSDTDTRTVGGYNTKRCRDTW